MGSFDTTTGKQQERLGNEQPFVVDESALRKMTQTELIQHVHSCHERIEVLLSQSKAAGVDCEERITRLQAQLAGASASREHWYGEYMEACRRAGVGQDANDARAARLQVQLERAEAHARELQLQLDRGAPPGLLEENARLRALVEEFEDALSDDPDGDGLSSEAESLRETVAHLAEINRLQHEELKVARARIAHLSARPKVSLEQLNELGVFHADQMEQPTDP